MTSEKSLRVKKSVFEELRTLFPNQQTTNPVEVYLRLSQGKDRLGKARRQRTLIDFGRDFLESAVEIAPHQEERVYRGSEFVEAVIDFYNRDYWLMALWAQMSTNAEGSYLGRELVRAFVKHGIFLTGEYLHSQNRRLSSRFIRSNGLSKRVNFYRNAFDWSAIFSCMRLPARRRISELLSNRGAGAPGHQLASMQWEDVSNSIPEVNQILAYSDLPRVAVDLEEQSENIGPIFRFIYMQSLFWRDSRLLRKALSDLLRET